MASALILTSLALALTLVQSLPDPVYTIHYVRNYRGDLIQENFGCRHSVVFGTYLHPTGPVDALYMLFNSNMYGFSANCNRPATYIKLFGDAQQYDKIMTPDGNTLNQIAQIADRVKAQVIIHWKYLPQGQQRQNAFDSLLAISNHLKQRGHETIVKAPASYFCAQTSNGKRFILDLSVNEFIMELYGEEPGQYTTYESIFGEESGASTGYTADCPKYPTRSILKKTAPGKKIHFEKTLDSSQPGFVGSNWEKFLQKAGQSESSNIYFYDGYPAQTVDF